jgi:hypothetical protein
MPTDFTDNHKKRQQTHTAREKQNKVQSKLNTMRSVSFLRQVEQKATLLSVTGRNTFSGSGVAFSKKSVNQLRCCSISATSFPSVLRPFLHQSQNKNLFSKVNGVRHFSTNNSKKSDDNEADKHQNTDNTTTNSTPSAASTPSSSSSLPIVDEANMKEDSQLILDNEGLMPRLWKTLDLFKPEIKDKFFQYAEENILPQDKFVIASNLFVDLEHPLLVSKYAHNFSPKEFLQGAQVASREIRQAVSIMEIKDEDKEKRMEALELLKMTMSPPLFTLYKKAFELMERPVDDTVLGETKISRFTMISATPYMVNEEYYAEEEQRYKRLGELLVDFMFQDDSLGKAAADSDTTATGAVSAGKGQDLLEEVVGLEKWLHDSIQVPRIYPIGSVLLKVDVTFDTEEETISRNNGVETKRTSYRNTFLTFESCISGQVPVDWIITHMDTVAKKKN